MEWRLGGTIAVAGVHAVLNLPSMGIAYWLTMRHPVAASPSILPVQFEPCGLATAIHHIAIPAEAEEAPPPGK
jgi:hypothetical protein